MRMQWLEPAVSSGVAMVLLVVAAVEAFVLVLGWALCRIAAIADRDTERLLRRRDFSKHFPDEPGADRL